MSFVDRTYPDVVRDVLTNLTQGVTREVHRVAYDASARHPSVPDIVLQRRPVRRVSLVEGVIAGATALDDPVPYVFSLRDYELVPNPADPSDLNTIRFLPFGKRPAPDSDLRVNYYPRTADPTVLTDLNVGSVVRTLVEATSRELALLYEQLNLAYDSAFLETASGASLNRVVALLGYRRFRAGRPVGAVEFTRRAGTAGNITIPAGTPVTDAEDKVRYETIDTHDMLAGESSAQVRVRGATDATPAVDTGTLRVIQRAIAGLDSVTNPRPTTRATQDETDSELRERTRAALLAANKGTIAAIRFGLLQMPEVRDVKLEEMPNGIAGEVRLSISLADGISPAGGLPPTVLARIEDLRPAGIRVLAEPASGLALQVQVSLVLAGSHLPTATVEDVHRRVRSALVSQMSKVGVGQVVRNRPLVAALLADGRIVDASLTLAVRGDSPGQPGADLQPPGGASISLAADDVTFGADTFDQPLRAGAESIPVEVRAVVAAQPLPGVPIEAARTQITTRLTAYFAGLLPGTQVDSVAVLAVLRDDSRYALDPLRLRVTLAAQDQFVQVAQGGQAFQVLPGHAFSVAAIEVIA